MSDDVKVLQVTAQNSRVAYVVRDFLNKLCLVKDSSLNRG